MKKRWEILCMSLFTFMIVFIISGCGTEEKSAQFSIGDEAAIDTSNVPAVRLLTESSFALMSEQYLLAAMATERAVRTNVKDNPEMSRIYITEAEVAWQEFEKTRSRTLMLCDLWKNQETTTDKKIALHLDELFTRALAATGAFQEQMQQNYEQSGSWTYADVAKNMGTMDGELISELLRQQHKNDPNLNKELETLSKVAKIGTGILLIPVGIGVGLVGAGTGGVVSGVIGLTATMSGALSTAIDVGESLSGKSLTGTNRTVKNTINLIAVTSSGANVVVGFNAANKEALLSLGKSGNDVSRNNILKLTTDTYLNSQGTIGKVLLVNDAKSAADLVDELSKQGLDGYFSTDSSGRPCIILEEKQTEDVKDLGKKLEDMTSKELNDEIKAKEAHIKELRDVHESYITDSDWQFRNAVGMTRDEWYGKKDALIDEIYELRSQMHSPPANESDEVYNASINAKIAPLLDDYYKLTYPYIEYNMSGGQYEKDRIEREAEEKRQLEEIVKNIEEEMNLIDKAGKKEEEERYDSTETKIKGEDKNDKEVSGEISGDSPFAVNKVIGASGSFTDEGVQVHFRLIAHGDGLGVELTNSVEDGVQQLPVSEYNPDTGSGIFLASEGESIPFTVTGTPGNMTMNVAP